MAAELEKIDKYGIFGAKPRKIDVELAKVSVESGKPEVIGDLGKVASVMEKAAKPRKVADEPEESRR